MFEWLTLNKAAALLGRTREVVRQLCLDGAFVNYKVSFGTREDDPRAVFVIPRASFIEWLKAQPVKPVVEEVKKPREFTMNCLSRQCSGYTPTANGIVKIDNKFVRNCPDCVSILKQVFKRSK